MTVSRGKAKFVDYMHAVNGLGCGTTFGMGIMGSRGIGSGTEFGHMSHVYWYYGWCTELADSKEYEEVP